MSSPSKYIPGLNILVLQRPIHRYSKQFVDMFYTEQGTPDKDFSARPFESTQATKSTSQTILNLFSKLPFPVSLFFYPTILVIRVFPTRFILTNGHSILLRSRNWFLPITQAPSAAKQVLSALIFPKSSSKNSVSTKQAFKVPHTSKVVTVIKCWNNFCLN